MNEFLLVAVIIAGFIIAVFLITKEIRRLKESKDDSLVLNSLRQNLMDIKEDIKESRKSNLESLQVQLKESGRIVKDVTSQLEKIHSDHKHVLDVKERLGKLTDILANPKQRGILGEYQLETLLKNIFQPRQYQMQYKFRDGQIVDAVIFIKDKIVPVDAKFSLENYNRILEEKDPVRKKQLEKVFKNDLKFRIEETAKYVRPDEGTMEFAFMFIPSEGIFYDLLINQVGGVRSRTSDLIEYAFKEKRVIITSPTSFCAYLQTVLQGLKALQIEESAKGIIKKIETLQKHLLKYNDYQQRLGNNLRTTVNTYNQSYKEFSKIDKDMSKLTGGEQSIKPLELEKPENQE